MLQGSQLQVDCSFDEDGQYTEQGKEWENLTIDSVTVTAADSQSPDTIYTVTADNLSKVCSKWSVAAVTPVLLSPCLRTCMRGW